MRDEEHEAGARISLERAAKIAPFAITCGIYGFFFHTCYFGEEAEARRVYDAMMVELGRIINLAAPETEEGTSDRGEVMQAISEFVERFPT